MKQVESKQTVCEIIQNIRTLRNKVMYSNIEVQKEQIFKDSPYSLSINKHISNYREFYLYYTLNLQETVVTRPALVKEIDFDLWISGENSTNRDLMKMGKSPYAYDNENGIIELHHIGQNYDAPFAELTMEEHLMYGNNQIFHTTEQESWRKDKKLENAFKKERAEYWKKRVNTSSTIISNLERNELKEKEFQLPMEIQDEIKETISLLFNECSVSDLDYLSDLAKSYALIKKTGVSSMSEFIFSMRSNHKQNITCSHCKSKEYVLFGTYLTVGEKIQRYKCKSCGKVFTATNKSLVSGSSFSFVDWIKFIDCLYNGYTIAQTAKTCNISERTAYDNRIKLFYALKLLDDKVKLSGNIVIDETFIPVSFKGNHSKDEDFVMPRKAHKRGKESHEKNTFKNQVCVVCALDDNGNSVAHVCGTGASSAEKIGYVLDNYLDKENMICFYSDKSGAIKKYANSINIEIKQAKSDIYNNKQNKTQKESFITYRYIQTINSYHSRLKRFMSSFSGISTKLLSGYLYLFAWKERSKDKEPIEAYKELLAIMTEPNLYISVEDINKNKFLPDALEIDKSRKKARFANLERDSEIYRRYAEGETMASIAKSYNMSRQNVSVKINRFRDLGLAYKTKKEIEREENNLNYNSKKLEKKLRKFDKRYNREYNVYILNEVWKGSDTELYNYIERVYGYTKQQAKNIVSRSRYREKMAEDFFVYEDFSHKSLEDVYREIYAKYNKIKAEFPDISNRACYIQLAEKYNYCPDNIKRIVKIMSTEKETNYFEKKRKFPSNEKIERDKAIFVDYLQWTGEIKDFYSVTAKKYNLSVAYIRQILTDILVSNYSRYDMI